MKDYLEGGLTEDQGGLGGLLSVLVHVGHEPYRSRGPWPPPRRGVMGRALVEIVSGGKLLVQAWLNA